MAKPSASWKNFEREICTLFGGKRRGADYSDGFTGKNDCIGTKGWSIEIKFLARPSWGVMQENSRNAVQRAEKNEIPIGIVRKKGEGSVMENTLVTMPLKDFLEWFVNTENDNSS